MRILCIICMIFALGCGDESMVVNQDQGQDGSANPGSGGCYTCLEDGMLNLECLQEAGLTLADC